MLHQTETVHPRKAGPTRRAKPWSEMLVDTQEGRRSPASLLLAAFLPSSIIYWLKLAKGRVAWRLRMEPTPCHPLWSRARRTGGLDLGDIGQCSHHAQKASLYNSPLYPLARSFFLPPLSRYSPSLGEGGVNGPLGPNPPLPLFWALQSVMSP